MKFKFWLLAVVALLLARVLVSLTPSTVQGAPSAGSQPNAGIEQVSADQCQTVRPAVVTLYAGREFGSGSIISREGLVLTNHHVVKHVGAGVIRAKTWTGALYTGQVVAADPINDLALVQLNTPDQLPTIRLSSLEHLQGGQPVCAIGSPYGRAGVLSRGMLTGVRSNGDLQSTLLLHPGNSGGPLLNLHGEMIGVNKTIWRSNAGKNTGISFAVSVAAAKPFIDRHQANAANRPIPLDTRPIPTQAPPLDFGFNHPPVTASGSYTAPQAPSGSRLGVLINQRSLIIQQVDPGSLAERIGLSVGDQVVALNGQSIQGFDQLQAFFQQYPKVVDLTVSRNNQLLQMRMRLEGSYRRDY